MTTRTLPPLTSNGYLLSDAPRRLGWLVPSDPRAPLAALHEQYRAQGYLWLKGFFDPATIVALRRRFFATLAPCGLLQPGSDPADGLANAAPIDRGLYDRLLMEFVRTAAFEAFCLHERLWQFYETFLGGAVYLHKRKIVRSTQPGNTFTTPAHYDLIYLRGGTDSVVTSWIPIGDVPVEMGGLVYLEHSDRMGRALEAEFAVRNAELSPEERINAYNKNMTEGGWVGKDLAAMADHFDTRWLVADYEVGDMVVHSAYMIHAATSNQHPTTIRLSTDIRYQRVRDEIDARWTQHWSLNDML